MLGGGAAWVRKVHSTMKRMETAAGTRRTAVREKHKAFPGWTVFLSFFLIEVYGFCFLSSVGEERALVFLRENGLSLATLGQLDYWPLAFGLLWAGLLWGITRLLPRTAGRIVYGLSYFLFYAYTVAQTGYYLLFRGMMWLSDFRYASEGSDYFDVLLQYPVSWWIFLVGLAAFGIFILVRFPRRGKGLKRSLLEGIVTGACLTGIFLLPYGVFQRDAEIRYSGSDYGRAQSAEAAYTTMFNAHRVYEVCGVFQTSVKDLGKNILYPLTPSYARRQEQETETIVNYFVNRETDSGSNEMTGLFQGKNVILVLMESMDDWAFGENTPTLNKLMDEGINFTNMYTPGYGSVRTFNSEFCANTGMFLSSKGGYAFDYVTNNYSQSLANLLRKQGYSALTYHYNSPDFYSRGVFSPAMGYEKYISYEDYVDSPEDDRLYDDQFLFDNEELSESFFREGKKLNFIITRSAHLSYVYNEVLSNWGLKKYPEYRGLTGNEEEDCMYLKARLVDDMFARLLKELEAHGELQNTVIVAFTDHYSYGVKDQDLVMERSGVSDPLLVEKTPFFIWSADCPSMTVDKTLNTSDILPTVLNLLNVPDTQQYLGQDAFDSHYPGYAIFPDGSWIAEGIAYSAERGIVMNTSGRDVTDAYIEEMSEKAMEYINISNLLLDTDYYKRYDERSYTPAQTIPTP